jgi:flavoprotein
VTFPHRQHQLILKGCSSCHVKGPGKIVELNKNWAHSTCKGCHATMKAGPTSCSGCHKK